MHTKPIQPTAMLALPQAENNLAIRRAGRRNDISMVKLLLADSRVDPAAKDNDAVIGAVHWGHIEVVRLLLTDSRVNPTARYGEAIREATHWGWTDMIKLLVNSVEKSRLCGRIK